MKSFSKPRQFRIVRPSQFTLPKWSEGAAKDRLFITFTIFWLVPILAIILFVLINFSILPNQIPLFYSQVWGQAQLAPAKYIFLPPVGSFVIGIANIALAANFYARDKVISFFLAATAALVSLLSFITTFNIVNLMR